MILVGAQVHQQSPDDRAASSRHGSAPGPQVCQLKVRLPAAATWRERGLVFTIATGTISGIRAQRRCSPKTSIRECHGDARAFRSLADAQHLQPPARSPTRHRGAHQSRSRAVLSAIMCQIVCQRPPFIPRVDSNVSFVAGIYCEPYRNRTSRMTERSSARELLLCGRLC